MKNISFTIYILDYLIANVKVLDDAVDVQIVDATRFGDIPFLTRDSNAAVIERFLESRVVSKDNPYIDEILKSYRLKEYDMMKMIRRNKGKKHEDNIWIEIHK
jgi:hypothetical protein